METQNTVEEKKEEVVAQEATQAQAPAEGEAKKEENVPGVPGSRAEHIREALEVLYERYPKCFMREGDLKPLKVGILEDLKKIVGDLGMSTSRLRAAVRMYTTRLRYLYNVKEGVMRIDLEGNETDAVTAEHEAYAKEKFEEINKKRKEAQIKKQKEQQRRQRRNGKPGFNKRPGGFKKPFNNNRGPGMGQNGPRPYNNRFRDNNAQQSMGDGTRPSFRKPQAPTQVKYTASRIKKDFKVPSLTRSSSNASALTQGTEVMVKLQNGPAHGVVAENAVGGMVKVTMDNGMTVSFPIFKVSNV